MLSYIQQKLNQNTADVGAIGVHFALEKLHLVQITSQAKTMSAQSIVSCAYPENLAMPVFNDKKALRFIRDAVRSGHFIGRNAVSALPAALVRVMSLSYSTKNIKNADAALLAALKERVNIKLDDYVIDYIAVRSDKSSHENLSVVAFAKYSDVFNYLEMLRKAGLHVTALEIGPLSIKRLVSTMNWHEKLASVLVINFGAYKSYLTMISGKRLLFDRAVDFGAEAIFTKIKDALGVSRELAEKFVQKYGLEPHAGLANQEYDNDNDTREIILEIVKPIFLVLVEEINKALLFAASETHGQAISCAYLLGEIARWPGVDQYINYLVDVPVATLNPCSVFDDQDIDSSHINSNIANPSELAVATGLALRGVQQYA